MIPSPSPSDILLARREVELLRQQRQLENENQIAFFAPHEKQRLFFAASSYRRRYARTGNRFGKSEMGAAEDVSFALGYRPWYPEGDPLRTLGIPNVATKGLIVTTDWDKSTEIFTSRETGANMGKLFKYIPKSAFVDATKNHSGAIDRVVVRHISGANSVIHLDTVKSYKQNPLGQESSAWDWTHIDEPCPEQMWKAIARGLVDRNGKAWFTCTPLTEPWIDQKFIPETEDQIGETGTGITGEDHWWMMGSMYDNPHNTPEAIAMFISELTDEEKECRISGIPSSYAGLVYKEFIRSFHVRKEPPVGWANWHTPPADHCIYIANDYHFRKNNANLFIAVPPDGPAYIYAELWQQLLVEEEVNEIRNILQGRPYQPILMDPLASTPNKVNDLTAMDEYRMRGLAVLPATKDPVNGIRAVKALLKSRARNGGPCIIINATLSRFLFEISRGFIWDGDQNKPVKNNDDMMECLYRLVLQGLRYIEPASDGEYLPIAPRDISSNALSLPWDREDEDEARKARKRASRYRPSGGGSHSLSFEEERYSGSFLS